TGQNLSPLPPAKITPYSTITHLYAEFSHLIDHTIVECSSQEKTSPRPFVIPSKAGIHLLFG
ncbi:MAG: hypothetical protein OEV68_16920, partial [candidate division Zixibacteria bacterium]|nr:hypothetical protein [candidate division Zixibacteria bacterium]